MCASRSADERKMNFKDTTINSYSSSQRSNGGGKKVTKSKKRDQAASRHKFPHASKNRTNCHLIRGRGGASWGMANNTLLVNSLEEGLDNSTVSDLSTLKWIKSAFVPI